jgi:hypothetical protein
MPFAPWVGLMMMALVVPQPPASGERRGGAPPAAPTTTAPRSTATGAPSATPRAPQSTPPGGAQRLPTAQELRDSTPPAVVSWERITWAIEQGLQPVEIDRLRRFGCIPGRLMPATYARLFRALALWKLSDDERDRRIDSWRCGTGQPAPASVKPRATPKSATRKPVAKAPNKAPVRTPSPTAAVRSGRAGAAPVSGRSSPRSASGMADGVASASASARAGAAGAPGAGSVMAPPVARPPAPSRPSAGNAGADTTVLLSVVSSVGSLPVFVNRMPQGAAPVSQRVPRGRLVAIAVGEGGARRDTTLYVTGRHDLVVTIERGSATPDRTSGAPLPVASALTRTAVEAEISMALPPLPRQPVMPTMRTPRGARTDLYWSLAVAGVAALASSPHCRTQATSPAPYGGTYTGTYHPAGTFVPSAFLLCTSAIGITSGAVSYPIFRIFSRFANEGERSRYVADSASLQQRQAAYVQVARVRQSMVDSALAQRQQERGMPLLRWRVDTIPRRLP